MRRATPFSRHKSRLPWNRFASRRCPGEIAPVFEHHLPHQRSQASRPAGRQAMSGTLKGPSTRTARSRRWTSAPRSAPHDLRRTAAMMCGNLGLSESAISRCLDHQATKGDDGQPLPAINSKVYNVLSSAVSSESARCWTLGRLSCGVSSTGLRRPSCL
jgi:integrase